MAFSLVVPQLQAGQCRKTHGDRRQAAAAGGHAASRNPAGLEGWTDTTKRKREGDSPMGMTTPRTATVRFSPMRKCSPPAGGEGERSERTESE